MVAETPLEELPEKNGSDSAMQIEPTIASPSEGEPAAAVGADKDLPSGVSAGVRPRSYLDSVVGQGSDAAPFLVDNQIETEAEVTVGQDEEAEPAAEDHRSVRRQGYNPPGVGVFSRARPYRPWMIVMRKERRPAGPPQRQNDTTGIGNGGASTSGSRFAPLEETDDRDQIPTAIPDAVQVRVIEERSSTDLTRVPHQSRADPAVAERSSPRTTNRGLRRAAKEDEHTVNRGEKGGAVVTTTRVQHSDRGEPASTAFDAPSNEHHGDPPDGLDCEGDVVMEIEDQQSSGHVISAKDSTYKGSLLD
nr:uncharacterized protein LOC109156749 [Ipomoea batatas]